LNEKTYWIRIVGNRIEFFNNPERKGKPIQIISDDDA